MSDKTVEVVSEQVDALKDAWSKLGSTLPSPYIRLAFTTLSVIPELRITDKGLLDTEFQIRKPNHRVNRNSRLTLELGCERVNHSFNIVRERVEYWACAARAIVFLNFLHAIVSGPAGRD
jgi:hypothetical protein